MDDNARVFSKKREGRRAGDPSEMDDNARVFSKKREGRRPLVFFDNARVFS